MILFFTKGDRNTASSRQRVWYLAKKLKERYDLDCEIVHSIGYSIFSLNPKRFVIWWKVIKKLFNKKYKIFFVHKSHFPLDIVKWIILLSKVRRVPIIYDIDDAEWVHSRLKTKLLAKNASVVFCGSHYIKEKIENWTKKTKLIPTVINFEIYKKYTIKHQDKDVLNIGWIGFGPSYVAEGHLEVLRDALQDLSKDIKLKMIFIGSKGKLFVKDYFKGNYEIKFIDEIDWSDPNEVPKVLKENKIDVGVAPILETKFDKAKCAFKIIEYMAVGLPVVVSPVGEQAVVVRETIDGFYARDKEEWIKNIKQLSDVKLRDKMGKSGQDRIERIYSFGAITPVINNEIRGLIKYVLF